MRSKDMEEEIGRVTHYYKKIGVVIIELSGGIRKGDKIAVRGKETNFEQSVGSIQIEHKEVETASAGSAVGVKVDQKVREGDKVFKLS